MHMNIRNESRRDFLKAGAGLTLGFCLGPILEAGAATGTTQSFLPNAFLRIGADNTVTVIVKHLEMGQGANTGLATLVAEELDAAWGQVRAESAPADAQRYANLYFGGAQGVGGSTGLANSYEQYRRAGAAARRMLVAAAAKRWQVDPATIQVSEGIVSAGKQKAGFGELAEAAAMEPVPTDVKLKDPKDFRLIGRSAPRKDAREKISGRATFTQDVKLPGLLTAVVAHPPRFGAKLKSFDASRAKAMAGVVDAVAIPNGVAVLAKDFWSAKKGRDALQIEWDESAALRKSCADLVAEYRALAATPGLPARHNGDATAALERATKRIDAEFEFPYLAHATMEPLNCVVKLSDDGCEIWNGCQMQTVDQGMCAAFLGLKPQQVKINTLYAGGSFGRRGSTKSDYTLEAVSIAKAISGRAPVKLVWTREDDLRAGYYRPQYLHRISAGIDAAGKPVAWQQRIVGQSIFTGTYAEGAMVRDGVDSSSVEGAANMPYQIPHCSIELHTTKNPVPVLYWRSVGSTHTAYAVETMIDDLAHAAGRDPVDYRRELLKEHPRHLGVLALAAEKSGWGTPLKPLKPGKTGERQGRGIALHDQPGDPRGRGIAVHESFGSYVAQVAEVTVQADGSFRVDRVVCAVDCGVAVNPDNIAAQMQGGIVFGLSAALFGAITLKDGVVEQSNFDDYPVLRIHQTPRIEVHIVPSAAPPTGVGEPGVPPIAPAVANALFAATGKRLRRLPFETSLLKS